VEIQDFSATQILREFNFGELKDCEIAFFAIFRPLNIANLANFSLQKVKNVMKIKI